MVRIVIESIHSRRHELGQVTVFLVSEFAKALWKRPDDGFPGRLEESGLKNLGKRRSNSVADFSNRTGC